MKFDFIVGNPPYQEDMESTSDNPVYNYYMDAVYEVADKVELISPARFLFNAGKTPKEWNKKMLSDPHLKVMHYWPSSADIFQGPDIKGGIVITYRDGTKDFGSINHFIPSGKLRNILLKIINVDRENNFSIFVKPTEYYKLTDVIHDENPDIKNNMSKGHNFDLTSNLLDKNPKLFIDNIPDEQNYVCVFGRQKGKRVKKYIKSKYIKQCYGIYKYKVIIPESNNSGQFGETLVNPIIGKPGDITTQTFLTIGFFDTEDEAKAVKKYISCKFSRAMLGILKITQHNKKDVWKYVPLQDFTSDSDIDWSKSISEIDQQLYKKYGLDEKEIEFIETHVKEME